MPLKEFTLSYSTGSEEHRSDGYSDEETSSGVDIPSHHDSQDEYTNSEASAEDGFYHVRVQPEDDIEPSDSASRPRVLRHRSSQQARPAPVRRKSSRRIPVQDPPPARATYRDVPRRDRRDRDPRRRLPSDQSSASVDHDDYPYPPRGPPPAPQPHLNPQWADVPPQAQAGYPPSMAYNPFAATPRDDQMIPYFRPDPYGYGSNPFSHHQYGQPNPFSPAGTNVSHQGGYFGHDPHARPRNPRHSMSDFVVTSFTPGSPYPPYAPHGYGYPHPYQPLSAHPTPPPGKSTSPVGVPTPGAVLATSGPEAERLAAIEAMLKAQTEAAAEEAARKKKEKEDAARQKPDPNAERFAALEAILKKQADDIAAKKAAKEQAAAEALAAAEAAKKKADEDKLEKLLALIAAQKEEAVARAKEVESQEKAIEAALKAKEAKDLAEKEAAEKEAKKLADVAAEAKKAAEEAAAAAVKEAKEAADKAIAEAKEAAEKAEKEKKAAEEALAKVKPAGEEAKAPIKFKDAVGRKFQFPFHLCKTWKGMEDLIKQAFMHVDVIGPQVHEGHYDLVGPNGDIILPQIWETTIEPDWQITMHMWPMPEPEAAPAATAAAGTSALTADMVIVPPPKVKSGGKAKKGVKTHSRSVAIPVPPPAPTVPVVDVGPSGAIGMVPPVPPPAPGMPVVVDVLPASDAVATAVAGLGNPRAVLPHRTKKKAEVPGPLRWFAGGGRSHSLKG